MSVPASVVSYGSDGLRRRMVTGTNTTDYLLDGQSVVREIKNGVVNATYLNGPRGPEYKRVQNGAVAWYLYDGLGSVVGLVDESGNVTSSRKYDVYGAPRNAQTGSAHCFVGGLGHTSDAETGLIYMRARYMDPATGRFVSEDPVKDGGNWFAYCGGDPVNAYDPDGKITQAQIDWWCSFLQGFGASLVHWGLVEAALGALAWYMAETGGGAMAWPSKMSAAVFTLGLLSVAAGVWVLQASYYMAGMTPEEYEQEKAMLDALLATAFQDAAERPAIDLF